MQAWAVNLDSQRWSPETRRPRKLRPVCMSVSGRRSGGRRHTEEVASRSQHRCKAQVPTDSSDWAVVTGSTGGQWAMGEDLSADCTPHLHWRGGNKSPRQEGRDVSRRGKQGYRGGQVSGECWSTAEFIPVEKPPMGTRWMPRGWRRRV